MERKDIIKRLCEIIMHCVLWFLTVKHILVPISPILLLVVILRSSEKIIFFMLYSATPFALEEISWHHKRLKNLPVINVVLLMDGKPNLNEFREIVIKRMLNAKDKNEVRMYPRGKQRMKSGIFNSYWVDEANFDIEKHIYEIDQTYNSVKEMQEAISNLSTVLFDDDLSPWEFILLDYLDESQMKSAIMFRIHHSMADGGSLIYFLLNVLSDEKSFQIKPRRFKKMQKMYVMAQAYLNIPFTALKQLIPYTPSHSLHCTSASGRKIFTWSDPLSLDTIQSLKNKLNVTINDIMLGTLATSFHDYFKKMDDVIPSEVMTAFPVDVRGNIEEAKSFSNKFAILPISLPTSSGDSILNIRTIHKKMKKMKNFGEPITYHVGMCFFNYFLPNIINDAIQSSFINKTSLVLSNVAGPQVPVKLGNTEINSIIFWPAPKYNLGMSCSIFSYKNKITIGFSYDKTLYINADDILKRIPVILDNLVVSL